MSEFTVNQLIDIFKKEKYDIKKLSSKRIVIQTDQNRVMLLKSIAKDFNGKYDPDIKGSSAGGTIVNGTTILVKPKKGVSSVHYENDEINSINNQLKNIMNQYGFDYVPFKFKNKIYNIVECHKTQGTPKSDFHLIDTNGKEVLWISHKAGKTPKDFQQWSGISKAEPKIFNHPEVKLLSKDVLKMFPDKKMPNATTIARKIKDDKLKKMAVYGSDFGLNYGRQNVNYVLQGNIKIVPQTGSLNYTLKANNTHINGDDITGGFEPVFMIIYKGDRDNLGLKGARAGILPIESRKINMIIRLSYLNKIGDEEQYENSIVE